MNSLTSFVDHPIWFERASTVTHVTPSGLACNSHAFGIRSSKLKVLGVVKSPSKMPTLLKLAS